MSEVMLPVGRMIGGSLYKPQARLDNAGKPKLDATGQPQTEFNFGVAIPKGPEQHWAQTPWGQEIYKVGAAAYPNLVQTPTFAWKIVDGDSQIPNKKGRKPFEQEGYRGCWVIWLKQSWAPSICSADGKQQLTEPDAVVPGYFIQVYASVKGNAPSPTPGVYLNPIAVALSGYGERIETSSVDTTSVGFGQGATPPGMLATPPASFTAPPPVPAGPVPGAFTPPPVPPVVGRVMLPAAGAVTYEAYKAGGWSDEQLIASGYMQAPAASPVIPPAPVAAPGPAIPPAPGFLTPGVAAPPPAPAAGPVMLPAANGVTYEAYKAGGWTDDQLRANGFMA